MSTIPEGAKYWIEKLRLKPHPEGGFYREMSRGTWITASCRGDHRFAYTSIYFLLTADSPSHLHRIQSDELWMHHAGDPIDVHVILQHPQDAALCAAEETPVDPSAIPLHTAFTPTSLPPAPDTGKEYEVYRCVSVGNRCDSAGSSDAPVRLQYTVPRRAIFGSTLSKSNRTEGYTLVSCVVAPGFSFDDFEVFTQEELLRICPQHETIIRELAYETIPSQSQEVIA